MSSKLSDIRSELNIKGVSEWLIQQENDDLAEHLQKIHLLKSKINQEKIEAIQRIDSAYKEELELLENDYALILKLSAL